MDNYNEFRQINIFNVNKIRTSTKMINLNIFSYFRQNFDLVISSIKFCNGILIKPQKIYDKPIYNCKMQLQMSENDTSTDSNFKMSNNARIR